MERLCCVFTPVCHSVHGGHAGIHTPQADIPAPWTDTPTPWADIPPPARHPNGQTLPCPLHAWIHMVTCGRYTSYWNAFLFRDGFMALLITAMKFREGNVFYTCLSVHRGWVLDSANPSPGTYTLRPSHERSLNSVDSKNLINHCSMN